MTDASTFTETEIPNPAFKIITEISEPGSAGKVLFHADVFDKHQAIKPEILTALAELTGGPVVDLKGGYYKGVIYAQGTDEVFLINLKQSEEYLTCVREQVFFYSLYNRYPAFHRFVVPMRRLLEDGRKIRNLSGFISATVDPQALIGMTQDYFGLGIVPYLKAGGVLTDEQIDEARTNYQEVLETTSGTPHGDLVYRKTRLGQREFWVANWDNVRIGEVVDSETSEARVSIKLLDYYGTQGSVRVGRVERGPNDKDPRKYREYVKEEPERLARALRGLREQIDLM